MPEAGPSVRLRVLYLIAAVLAAAQGGCLLAIAGVAAGGAATGYVYYKGCVYRDFPAALADTQAAVKHALVDLQFPLLTESAKDGKVFLQTRTAGGKKVRLYLECLPSPIPAEGTLTRVSIRVGTFGDEGVSLRILEQVGRHLAPGPVIPPPQPQPTPGPGPLQPASAHLPAETAPPPLAVPKPVSQPH